MYSILSLILFLAGTALVAGGLIWLARGPMLELLRSNSRMAPGARFYVRSFALIVALAALAAATDFHLPCAEQSESMTFMGCVWWAIDGLDSVFLSASLFLIGYVLLLTILFTVLGRYRDE